MPLPKDLADRLGIDADAASYTATLSAPFDLAGQSYADITLTEPTLDQMEEAGKKQGLASDRALIAIVGKVPESVAGKLSASEYAKAMAYLGFFIGGAQPNGASS